MSETTTIDSYHREGDPSVESSGHREVEIRERERGNGARDGVNG